MLPRRLSVVALLIVLASCAAPAPPVQPPAGRTPLPVPAPPVVVGADWRDWPVTPGDWSYHRTASGTESVFGTDGQRSFAIVCANDHMVRLERPGGPGGALTVRTSSTVRTLPNGNSPAAAATLTATDPLLDAMGYSRGHFVVEQAGAAPLVLPAWAEVLRVTEDCRR